MWVVINSFANTCSSIKNLFAYTVLFYKELINGTVSEYIHQHVRNYMIQKYQIGLVKPVNIKVDGKVQQYYDLLYYFGTTKYTLRFPRRRGVCSIYSALGCEIGSTEEVDICDTLKLYMGPSHNFYGIKTTCKMLGYESIKIEYASGCVIKYQGDDLIQP